MPKSKVRQRFTLLDEENARLAANRKKKLRKWRKSLHGSNWRTYACISDLGSVTNTEKRM